MWIKVCVFLFLKSKESALCVARNGKVFSLKIYVILFDVYDSCTVRRMCREMEKRQLDSSLTILYALQLRHSTLFQLACSVCFMLCYFFLFTKRWLCRIRVTLHGNLFFLSLSLCFPGSSSLISLLPPFCYNHSLHSCRPIDNQHRRGPAERDARWATQLGRDPKANLVGAPPLLSLFNISNCLSKLGNECLSRYRDWDWHNWIDFWTLSL